MIKINLSTASQGLNISNVGGLDFSAIKVKHLLLGIVVLYLPDYGLKPFLDEDLERANADVASRQVKLSSLKRKVTQSKTLEKQIRELKAQEENLGKKLTAVKQAISEKKNPAPLLLYLAKNIPEDLWIKDLSLENDVLVIKGEANNYLDIGNFMTNLKSSVFIKDANIVNQESKVRPADKKRIESFEVKFTIARFDQ